ncbi:MAG: tRNA modification GTPase [Myxococcota bacterium]
MASLDVKRKDTICALATPPGRSALAVVRVSGPDSQRVLHAVFRPRHGKPQRPFVATVGDTVEPTAKVSFCHPDERSEEGSLHVSIGGEILRSLPDDKGNAQDGGLKTPESRDAINRVSTSVVDEVVCTFYPPGRSYTGEAGFELSLHGKPLLVDAVLRVLQQAGCRLAEPGEFSLRAVLSGKLDLCKAQAVYDLIHARSTRAARAALRTLRGGLSEQLSTARASIVDALSEIEARLDFPEDDLGDIDPHDQLRRPLEQAAATLERLLRSAALGERLQQGARVVLCGRPNAGKSTLLNTLLGADKALVHDTPGTTRDVIEASWRLDGVPITLVDVAGLRARRQATPVEALGIAAARKELAKADLVLWLAECTRLTTAGIDTQNDPSGSWDSQEIVTKMRASDAAIATILDSLDVPLLHVCTKTDQLSRNAAGWIPACAGLTKEDVGMAKEEAGMAKEKAKGSPKSICAERKTLWGKKPRGGAVWISAHTGEGLDHLRRRLREALVPDGIADEEALLSTARQHQLVTEAHQALQQALQALRQQCAAEGAALQLRLCGAALDELLGGNLNEEVLNTIFSRFCIGK